MNLKQITDLNEKKILCFLSFNTVFHSKTSFKNVKISDIFDDQSVTMDRAVYNFLI